MADINANISTLHKMAAEVFGYLNSQDKHCLPFYYSAISAGFPSPADDYLDKKLNLDELLIKNPAATFFIRVAGDSMTGAGIYKGDILVVDRSLPAISGKIVVAIVDAELTVKRLLKKGNKFFLIPENPNYRAIEIQKNDETAIWGIVTSVLHFV